MYMDPCGACVRVCLIHEHGLHRRAPRYGHSCWDLLPTPRVGQAFVFLLPASCLLKTFRWPPVNGQKLVQQGRKGDAPLGPRGDLLARQVKGVGESQGDRLVAHRICTFLTAPPQEARAPTVLSPNGHGLLTPFSLPLACDASLKFCAMGKKRVLLWRGERGMDTVKFTVF